MTNDEKEDLGNLYIYAHRIYFATTHTCCLFFSSEISNLKENRVYELVDKPKEKKVVKSKRVETNEKGKVEKYKGKGYSEVKRIDYD